MGLTGIALKFAAPLPDIDSCERCLFIGPHPDDIEIGAGATAAKLSAAGKKLCFLVCTDGRFGDAFVPPGTSTEELIAMRRAESVASAKMLGVEDVRFLELSDGALYTQEELFAGILKVIGDFKPHIIFAPDPCVKSECHPDHLNVGEATRRAACFAPYPGIARSYGAEPAPVSALAFYMTADANRFVKVSPAHFDMQQRAVFACHLSQFPENSPEAKTVGLYLRLRSADFGLRKLCRHAEGFRVLGTVHMHCLPEAGK